MPLINVLLVPLYDPLMINYSKKWAYYTNSKFLSSIYQKGLILRQNNEKCAYLLPKSMPMIVLRAL